MPPKGFPAVSFFVVGNIDENGDEMSPTFKLQVGGSKLFVIACSNIDTVQVNDMALFSLLLYSDVCSLLMRSSANKEEHNIMYIVTSSFIYFYMQGHCGRV